MNTPRFKRDTFPKKKPTQRVAFAWGAALLYPDDHPRFAVIVTKKVFRKAVERNRAKRRVYAALQSAHDALPPRYSMVVHPKRSVLTVPLPQLIDDLSHITVS